MLGFGLGLNKWRRLGGGYVGLLDLYPNAAAAYSLRKLRAAYSGAAVRVRESGGNTEADIGFDANGDLDTSALLAHCGANDGFVTVWYDQSLSNDATQTTAANQPKIVSAGSLVTENGKAAIEFDGVDTILSNTSFSLDESIDLSGIAVVKTNDTATNQFIIASVKGSGNRHAIGIFNTGVFSYQKRTSIVEVVSGIADTNQNLLFTINTPSIYINTVLGASGATTLFNARVADNVFFISGNSSGTGGRFNGNMQEVVYWQANQSANRTAIETNINNFYSIYP